METDNENNAVQTVVRNDQVKKYNFNIYAFFFSVFYFMYLGLAGYFILFLFLIPLLALLLNLVLSDTAAIIVSLLISGTLAGFIADPAYKKYLSDYDKKYGKIDRNKPVEYYPISTKRLIFFAIISGGLYFIYWGYRNWKNYQKNTNDDVSPALRGWFFYFTVISLFKNMNITLKSKKLFTWYGFAVLGIFVTDRLVSSALSKNYIPDEWVVPCYVMLFLLAIIYPFFVVPVQKEVNDYTTNTLHKSLDKRFYFWEMFFVIIGALLNLNYWINGVLFPPKLTDEQADKVARSVIFIYRHTNGYTEGCAHTGYVLQKYPDDFKAYFADDIAKLNNDLRRYGYTLEAAENIIITPELRENIVKDTYAELYNWKKAETISVVAEKRGDLENEVEWNESLDNLIPMYNVCSHFDKEGLDMLLHTQYKDFLKDNAL